MKSLAVALSLLFCVPLVSGQSLTELAKQEKERRKKIAKAGVEVTKHTNSETGESVDDYDFTESSKTMEEYEAEMGRVLAGLGPVGAEWAEHVKGCTDVVTTQTSTESGTYVGQGRGTGSSRSRVTDETGGTIGHVDGASSSSTLEYGTSSKTTRTTSSERRWNEGCSAQARIISDKLDKIIYKYDALYTAYKKAAIEEGKLLQVVPRDRKLPTAAERQAGAKVKLKDLVP